MRAVGKADGRGSARNLLHGHGVREVAEADAAVFFLDRNAKQAEIASRLFGTGSTPLRIGRFAVLRTLGEGGMGRVYSAYDEQLDRRVAIKVLRREVDEASRRRILREAQAMAKLSHPNVIAIHDVGEHEGLVVAVFFYFKCAILAHVFQFCQAFFFGSFCQAWRMLKNILVIFVNINFFVFSVWG